MPQGFSALAWRRFGNWGMDVRNRIVRAPLTFIYRSIYKAGQFVGRIMLPYTMKVGRRVKIKSFSGIALVAQKIGDDCIIHQNNTLVISRPDDLTGWPVIGDRVEIGAGAVIVGRISIGHDSVVGANAVVTKSVPPGAVVGGVPARIICMRPGFGEDEIGTGAESPTGRDE